MTVRTTVAIPLFRASPWLEVVRANLDRLRGHAQLLVSDATEDDDSLARLRAELDGSEGVTFLGRRDLAAGWVAHCNDLIGRADTEFFMWLPQDDDIDADWVVGGERCLDTAPDAVLAAGRLVDAGTGPGAVAPRLLAPAMADSDRQARLRAGLESALTGRLYELGLAFRGVIRREIACPLPAEPATGEWADALWALRMLTRGRFVEIVGADYVKRRYPEATHYGWRDLRTEPTLREAYLPAALVDLPPAESTALLLAAWSAESAVAAEKLRQAWARVRQARARTDELRAEYRGSSHRPAGGASGQQRPS